MKKILFVAAIIGLIGQCECVQNEINEKNVHKIGWNSVSPELGHIRVMADMVAKGKLDANHESVQRLMEKILYGAEKWYLSKEYALLINELLNTPLLLGKWEPQILSVLREKREAGNFYAAMILHKRRYPQCKHNCDISEDPQNILWPKYFRGLCPKLSDEEAEFCMDFLCHHSVNENKSLEIAELIEILKNTSEAVSKYPNLIKKLTGIEDEKKRLAANEYKPTDGSLSFVKRLDLGLNPKIPEDEETRIRLVDDALKTMLNNPSSYSVYVLQRLMQIPNFVPDGMKFQIIRVLKVLEGDGNIDAIKLLYSYTHNGEEMPQEKVEDLWNIFVSKAERIKKEELDTSDIDNEYAEWLREDFISSSYFNSLYYNAHNTEAIEELYYATHDEGKYVEWFRNDPLSEESSDVIEWFRSNSDKLLHFQSLYSQVQNHDDINAIKLLYSYIHNKEEMTGDEEYKKWFQDNSDKLSDFHALCSQAQNYNVEIIEALYSYVEESCPLPGYYLTREQYIEWFQKSSPEYLIDKFRPTKNDASDDNFWPSEDEAYDKWRESKDGNFQVQKFSRIIPSNIGNKIEPNRETNH
ncbi:MAG: hypothetical protein LBJ71_00370, partial [Holosporaceae bacterium]|nr:hypothetical protein [Holosporaceae bacterium]